MSHESECDCGDNECSQCGPKLRRMWLSDFKTTAMCKWLKSLDSKEDAALYIGECVRKAMLEHDNNNMGLQLLEAANGTEWTYDMPTLLKSIEVLYE